MAMIAFLLSMIIGIPLEIMGFSNIGVISAISIMGFFIISAIQKNK